MARTRGMETQPVIAKQERIDDVPLLLGKSKLEGRPTAKRMLRAIAGLEMTMNLILFGDKQWWYLPELPKLLLQVLDLLGLSPSLYTNLANPRARPLGHSLASAATVASG